MDKYMKIAKELSEENLKTNKGGPFGACVVKNGDIIGKGSNHVLSDIVNLSFIKIKVKE